MLTDCRDPQLVADPETATRTETNAERVEVAKYAVCYRGKFWALRDWNRKMAE